jgi:hypothetical protein
MNILRNLFTLATVVLVLTSCDKNEEATIPVTTITKIDSINVNFSNTAAFVFFNFKNSTIVANADSASNKWDFGLRRTTFLVNSFSSGPGVGAAILQNTLYDAAASAPASGYAYDTTSTQRAIKDGSWYNYNPATRAFSPKSGQTFFFKTAAEGKFVKMELLSTEYVPFVGQFPEKLKFKFRFTYQDNGSTTF